MGIHDAYIIGEVNSRFGQAFTSLNEAVLFLLQTHLQTAEDSLSSLRTQEMAHRLSEYGITQEILTLAGLLFVRASGFPRHTVFVDAANDYIQVEE